MTASRLHRMHDNELAVIDGVPVVVVEVELRSESTVVRGAAVENETTERLLREWEPVFAEYLRTREAGADAELPRQPGDVIFSQVRLDLDDGLGGEYRCSASMFGGTGTDWQGEWTMAPGLPSSVAAFTIRAVWPGGVAVVEAPGWS